METQRDVKDLARGAIWNYLGMLARLSKVLFMFVAARYYGADALGIYFLAWNTINIVSKIGLMGMDRSIIRDINRYRSKDSEQNRDLIFAILKYNIGLALLVSLVMSVALNFLSPWIANIIFKNSELILPLHVFSFVLPLVVLTQVFVATTKAQRIMVYDVLILHTLEPLILLVGTLAFIPFKPGPMGLITAHVVASFCALSVAIFVTRRFYGYLGWRHSSLEKEAKKETLRYTTPIAAMDVLNLLAARMDILLVGALINSTAAGYYGIAVEIISIIKRIRQGFEPIFAPIVSELYYKKERKRLKRNYTLVTRWLMTGSFLPVIATILFARELLSLFHVYSSEAAAALMVLALAHGVFGSFSAAENILVMTGRSFLNMKLALITVIINGMVAVLLIPKFGLVGASLGMLAAFLMVSIARIYQGYQQLHIHPFSSALLWPLVTATSTFVVFLLIKQHFNLHSTVEILLILLPLCIFYGLIFFVGGTEPEEKLLLSSLKKKIFRKHESPPPKVPVSETEE